MTFEIFDSSELMKDAKTQSQPMPTKIYPFDELEVGKSFTVPYDDKKLRSLQTICLRKSKEEKKFRAIVHKEHKLIEVGRIA